jgi:hypothetical protein
VSEPQDPAVGTIRYYLVARRNHCGESAPGRASSGAAIPILGPCAASGSDADGDGIMDEFDNCPAAGNTGQADSDGDGRGDLCDNCPAAANPAQADGDTDGAGDVCDNCAALPNPTQANADGDALGDLCDSCPGDPANDADGDSVCGDVDNCPSAANGSQADLDGDQVGDACDPDIDGDGIPNALDCEPLSANNCNDANPCTDDSCNPGTGCVNANNAAPCDDGDLCTQTDVCQSGGCTGTNPVFCSAVDDCHLPGICIPATGLCSNPLAPDASPCNDGDACTQTDGCVAGLCTGANPVVCTALDQCHVAGTCNTVTGVCSNPNATDGTGCDDATVCTINDICTAGVCAGTINCL